MGRNARRPRHWHMHGRGAGARRRFATPGLIAILCCLAAGPLPAAAETILEAAPLPAPFSSSKTGGPLPSGWEPVKFSAKKHLTVYTLVEDAGIVVLHAKADTAASALAQFSVFDVRSAPVLEWRWKVSALIDGADNRVAAKDDSPVRILLAFDGDKSRLSFGERAVFYLTKQLSGRELPFALLEYVWANRVPVGTIIDHPYTNRVRMVVAASGPRGVGAWQTLRRNVYEDYRRAFGEAPGPLLGIGVLTDTDNTESSVEAWYGDIRLEAGEP